MVRIDHVNIVVADMERSIRFYEAVLGLTRGFETVLEGEWIDRVTGLTGARAHCVFMEGAPGNGGAPPARLELLQYLQPVGGSWPEAGRPNSRGLRHLAFNLEDLGELLARLAAAGVEPVSEPVEVPFAVGSMGRKRLCYFYDPDGTLLEAAAYG